MNTPTLWTWMSIVSVAGFFLFMEIRYSGTPQDPQKAVGYFFIALYCAVLATVVLLFAAVLVVIRRSLHTPLRLFGWLGTGLALLAIIIAMVIFALRHPA